MIFFVLKNSTQLGGFFPDRKNFKSHWEILRISNESRTIVGNESDLTLNFNSSNFD
jgi:hypothetical protein